MRTDILNKTCFKYPQIVKNEIEYLHCKLHLNFDENTSDEYLKQTRFEKEFMTGRVSNDYKSLLYKTSKVEEKKDEVPGKKFKVIVEGG